MLFVFGRPLVSGSATARRAARGPDMYSGPEKPARRPWTGGAHSLSFTVEFLSLLWDLVPNTSYSISSIFWFLYLIFSLNTSPPVPHSIHRCILTSICCFPGRSWLVFLFLFGLLHPVFTNGLLPYVSYSFT